MKKALEKFSADIPSSFSAKLKSRNLRSVTKTFHRAGLVVPFDRHTDVGYRPLQMSNDELKKLLKKFDEAKGDEHLISAAKEKLHPLITAANIGEFFLTCSSSFLPLESSLK